MAKIGYARAITDEQDNAIQVDALKPAGCEMVRQQAGFFSRLLSRASR